jgi:hypothetical protein
MHTRQDLKRNRLHTGAPGDVGPSNIDEDMPLRLAVAAAIAFPDGSMTASGLRRKMCRGRLVIERIAGKDYTTLNIPRRVSGIWCAARE